MDALSYLLGKKAGGGGGGTSNYNDLSNKPSINGVTLSGNKTTSDLGIQAGTSAQITIDMQNRLREETLEEVSEFITENVGKVVCVNVVDGSVYQSTGYFLVQNTINNFTPLVNETTSFGVTYQTSTIQGSWSNGQYEVSSIIYSDFNAPKSLSTTNTTTFTPTGDYHPATKKYVDDLVGDISTILESLVTIGGGN